MYAIIQNKTVVNLVVADSDIFTPQGIEAVLIEDGVFVSIGFLYENGVFVDPNPIPPEELISPQETAPT